jgi:hypothetical protein
MTNLSKRILLEISYCLLNIQLSSALVSSALSIHIKKYSYIRGCIQKFPDCVTTKYTTTINTRWEETQRVMAAKLIRLTHKIAIQLHLVHRVQNGSGAHPASYPMGTRGSFLGGKATGAWSWPLTSIYWRGQECVGLYLRYPNTPSWRSVHLKKRRDNSPTPEIKPWSTNPYLLSYPAKHTWKIPIRYHIILNMS